MPSQCKSVPLTQEHNTHSNNFCHEMLKVILSHSYTVTQVSNCTGIPKSTVYEIYKCTVINLQYRFFRKLLYLYCYVKAGSGLIK